MTKLVVYTENYAPGGLERFVLDLAQCPYFDIILLVNKDNERLIRQLEAHDVKALPVKIKKYQISIQILGLRFVFKLINFFLHYLSVLPNYFIAKQALRDLSSFENILIVNGGYPAAFSSFSAAIAAKRVGFKRVHMSVLSSPHPFYKNKFYATLQSKFDHTADKYIDKYLPNSSKIECELSSLVHINSKKIEVIHTGVEYSEPLKKVFVFDVNGMKIEKKDEEIWVVMVALIGSTKRQDLLIEAVGLLMRKYSKLKVLIAGDGPNRKKLESLVLKLKLQNVVHFTGWIEEPLNLYAFADIVVFASNHEGLPYSISEAMMYGRPIIASAVGGVPEQIIDGKGGLLFSNDVVELSDKIAYLVDHSEKEKQFVDFSHMRVKEHFSLDAMYNKFRKVYS